MSCSVSQHGAATESKVRRFFAHSDPFDSSRLPGEPGAAWRLLGDHLGGTAELARRLAKEASQDKTFARSCWWAGLLHDLGKYSDEFQAMLLDAASGRPKRRAPHAVHGAIVAYHRGAQDVALAILGHHTGLGAPRELRGLEFSEAARLCHQRARSEEELGSLLDGEIPKATLRKGDDLRIRMLFSCLIDADRLDAAAHGSPSQIGAALEAERLLARLLDYISLRAAHVPEGVVKMARREVLESCLNAASWPERLLTLTVPTGGGKTLAAMAFALKRAALNPGAIRRVVVVEPYLSIIEQNAAVYAQALGVENILEHHSGELLRLECPKGASRLASEGDELPQAGRERDLRLAVENWDAPVVVTTSVRFFETIFSNHPTDLRRLHNLAGAVVVLDEVQAIQPHLIRPILSVIKELADVWGTTFVFCTATQPAFERPEEAPAQDPRYPPSTLKEIIPAPRKLFARLDRVQICWPELRPQGSLETTTWAEVADRMKRERRALCIVNLKQHAAELFEELQRTGVGGLFHLSTRMCPAHRLDVLTTITKTLTDPRADCLVVSTQLVEAGVDLDFPVVFRALAPLDSIMQAAGRCDREGRLSSIAGKPAGRCVVFLPEGHGTPPGTYTMGAQITENILRTGIPEHSDPATITRYFQALYSDQDLDEDDIEALRARLDFPEVARRFAFIDDRTQAVIVPYGEGKSLIDRIRRASEITRVLLRSIQRYQVGLYPHEFAIAKASGVLYEVVAGSGIWCVSEASYCERRGLVMEAVPESFLV